MRHHGGDIAVKSQVGAGTCFTVSLPHERSGSDARPAPTTVPPVTGSVPGGLRALVVDDDEVVSMVLREMLRSQFGCLVDGATNGIEALSLLDQHDYALVISDIQMPLMNGPELFAQVNETKPHLARRFVFITGYAGGAQLSSKIEQWAVPVVAKPFTLTRLAEVCGPLLRRGKCPPPD